MTSGSPPPSDRSADPWSKVVGRDGVVRRLRAAVGSPVHAYLLLGPRGAGKRALARIFAGELLVAADDPEHAERHRRLAWREEHPDVHVLDPAGNQLRREEEAEPLVVAASRSPVEGRRKVLVVDRFHTATPAAAALLLKTVEEPPPTTVFVLCAEEVPPEHVTIASRCTVIEVPPPSPAAIRAALVAEGLADTDRAAEIATAALGNLDRARRLATDPRLGARREAWWSVPDRLDGTGAVVAALVDELRGLIDESLAVLEERHEAERAALAEREERFGTRGSGRRELEARHKREVRQVRTEELGFGLAVLAHRYRDALVAAPDDPRPARAVDRVRAASADLVRNPNEALWLAALLVDLPPL